MRAQYVSLCSNNDVILQGVGGQIGPKTCVYTKSSVAKPEVRKVKLVSTNIRTSILRHMCVTL